MQTNKRKEKQQKPETHMFQMTKTYLVSCRRIPMQKQAIKTLECILTTTNTHLNNKTKREEEKKQQTNDLCLYEPRFYRSTENGR